MAVLEFILRICLCTFRLWGSNGYSEWILMYAEIRVGRGYRKMPIFHIPSTLVPNEISSASQISNLGHQGIFFRLSGFQVNYSIKLLCLASEKGVPYEKP